MTRGLQGALLRAMGANEHVIRVEDVYDVVPGFRRVHFSSTDLFDDFRPGPTDYLRLWFPDPFDADLEVQRGYTIVDADQDAGTFVLDFVQHERAGPAAMWAARCAPGDEVAATVYGSQPFSLGDPEPAGVLLVGDAASIPAINSILGVVPPHLPVEVYLEWGDEGELAIPVAEHPAATIHRVRRNQGATRVVDALAGRDWSDWKAWIAAERTTTKRVKAALREQHGFPKSELKATAYWIHGRPFGGSRGAKAAAKAATKEHDERVEPVEPEPPTTTPEAAVVSEAVAVDTGAPARWRATAGVELLEPVRSTMRIAGAIQAVLTVAGLIPFFLLTEVGRRLLDGQEVGDQWPIARLALILLGAAAFAESALMLWLHVVDARFALAVRRRLLAKLARLPLGWFTERNGGVVKQAVTEDTARLHSLVTHAAPDAVGAVVAPLAVLVYLFVVDARLAAVLLLPVLAYMVLFSMMSGASRAALPKVGAWARRMDGEAGGYLDGLPVVRVFGGSAASRFRRSVDEYTDFLASWQRPFVSKKATAALITDPMTFLWLIIAVGGLLVATDRMAGADLLPFLLLGTTFGPRLLGLAYGLMGLRDAREAARRIGLTLTEAELETDRAAAEGAPTASGAEVRLEAVTFGYRPGHDVLHDVDLTLAPGTVTALVGPSGSGKSTLAALVARFHDPTAGRITIGGADLRSLEPDDLYRRIGFVLQDVHLLRETVHDNIALARPDATRDEVVAAAEAAAIAERIARLPDGYDTVLGDEIALSGGEAQRITIARAILADTPVVVLDEATAFADPESEYQVQLALSRLLHDRTVLVIAHRLHTVTDADRIVVLDGGRIVQSGTHDELVVADGRYRDLWRSNIVGSTR